MTIGGLPNNNMGKVLSTAERSGGNQSNHISHRLRVLFRPPGQLLLRRYRLCLIRCLVFDHAVADMDQLSHRRSQGAHFGLVCRQQALIKGLNVWLPWPGSRVFGGSFRCLILTALVDDANYYLKFGGVHGCIIIGGPGVLDYVFIHPRTAEVYEDYPNCWPERNTK